MSSDLVLERVVHDSHRRDFLRFPYRIYRDDPHWIPRLWPEQMGWLRRENGFFDHGDGEWFLARRQGEIVGTIGVAVDHLPNQDRDRRWGIFGFVEMVDDRAVFRALVEQARAWLRARGMTHMVGPQSFGGSDYPGFLVGRYDCAAALYEGHSPPYYLALAEEMGWERLPDGLAYRAFRQIAGGRKDFLPAKVAHAAERVRRNPRFGVRIANLREFEHEFQIVLRIYNRSLASLRDFTPAPEEMFRRMVEDLVPILKEDLVAFAMVDGREVGFSLALPNLAEVFHRIGGLRYPWQYARLWWGMRRVRSVSYKILAMEPEYWGMGLEALLFSKIIEASLRRGYEWMDLSLTAEDNPQTNKLATRMGAEEYKRYRSYLVEI